MNKIIQKLIDKYQIELLGLDAEQITAIAENSKYIALGTNTDEVSIHLKKDGKEITRLRSPNGTVITVIFHDTELWVLDKNNSLYIHEIDNSWDLVDQNF